jgi:hypothetical protein
MLTGAVTREDLLRAWDRRRVQESRSTKRWLRLVWLLAGPGVLVMLGENDGPRMISYATTGASYGIGFFVEDQLGMPAMRRGPEAHHHLLHHEGHQEGQQDERANASARSGATSRWAAWCSATC